MHAEAVLLVDHGQREIAERHVVLKQRVGADDEIDLAGGERLTESRRGRGRARGRSGWRRGCRLRRASGAIVAKCWRARISVGAIKAA